MEATEAAAASHLAARVVCEVATAVEGVHLGIVSRVRDALAVSVPGAAPIVAAVELQSRAVYAAVRATSVATGFAAAGAATVLLTDGRPAAETRKGAAWMAGLQAAVGDQLEEDRRTRALAPDMSFRHEGRAIGPAEAIDRAAVSVGDPGAQRQGLAVFLHGLGGTEYQWDPGYAAVLAEQGFGSVFVRYNTGRSIHANGTDLAELLSALADRLDAGAGRLMLVGHSMGGLVIRSGLGGAPRSGWAERVTDVVSLGTPHRGAPLEKVSAAALRGLRLFRESRPIAEFGDRRSIGIKDLRFGALRPDHWGGRDPDTVLCDTTADLPLPSHVRHHAVVGRIGPPGGLVGSILGDGMVRAASAMGRGDPADRVAVHRFHRTGHMTLLRHPGVADILAQVAGMAPARPGG